MMVNIIEAIDEKLQKQKDEIFCQKMRIEELTKELEAAKREIAALKGKAAEQ